jgi:hypothetical protein
VNHEAQTRDGQANSTAFERIRPSRRPCWHTGRPPGPFLQKRSGGTRQFCGSVLTRRGLMVEGVAWSIQLPLAVSILSERAFQVLEYA